MRRLGFVLGVTALLVTTGSVLMAGTAAGRFDQKLAKDRQVLHVLNRLTFGPRPGDVDRVRSLGIEKWIQQQLQPRSIEENPLVAARLQPLATLQLATWQIFETYQSPLQTVQVPAPVLPQARLAQLVSSEQLQKLSTGSAEERLAIIGSIAPQNLGPVLAALTPKMLEGLPDLQKLAEKARVTETNRTQFVFRTTVPNLNNLLTAEQRRVTQQGTPAERRALIMSFDAATRKQVLFALPPAALAGIPELQREALAARQPPMFVNQELIDSRMYRALYSNRQLEEVLVDFWLNHFNVFNAKGQERMLLTSYERDAIRPHVLGRFRDLLLATARHPAMLFYLDNWQSQAPREDVAAQPLPPNVRRPGLNENYGRELMELHTLGVDGGYTQDDVIAVARAFTGWTIYDVGKIAEFQFNPAFHDRKEKIVLGQKIPAGGGEQDGIQVIDILVRHPSTARFISRKLAQRFVADAPPQALVDRMAATFTATGGDLRAVVETMLTSREFLSEGAWQAKLKSPLEMVLSAARVLGADVTDATAIAQRIADLGQPLYGKAEPTGYSTTSDAWANSAGFLGRINFAGALASGQIDGVKVDLSQLPGNSTNAIDAARWLLGAAISRETLKLLEKGTKDTALSLASVAAVVLASPDFQRR
ncbi:MAG TPA: DUF1800 domain-containing protein [Vicinamibacterales bacterium]|nr:DUF1800 domain-containing protein [Vicinamibacterales bacterium]